MICRGNTQSLESRKQAGYLPAAENGNPVSDEPIFGPSYQNDTDGPRGQTASDSVEEASMQSFPASDPPSYLRNE
jgi:hypothetical protein